MDARSRFGGWPIPRRRLHMSLHVGAARTASGNSACELCVWVKPKNDHPRQSTRITRADLDLDYGETSFRSLLRWRSISSI
jgi:hypothetical protein